MKALCSERYEDWTEKFGPHGIKCKELTGDTELDDYFELQDVHIILTTPVSIHVLNFKSSHKNGAVTDLVNSVYIGRKSGTV